MTNSLPVPSGNEDPINSPHGLYKCQGQDEWIAISIQNATQWENLCGTIGKKEMSLDTRLSSPEKRRNHSSEIDTVITAFTSGLSSHKAMEILQDNDIPAGPSINIAQVYEDPHTIGSGYLTPQTYPNGVTRLMPGMPWTSNLENSFHLEVAPEIGASNLRIYKELIGISSKDYETYLENQIIY